MTRTVHTPDRTRVEQELARLYPAADVSAVIGTLHVPQIYLIGGFLRDLALDEAPKDADFFIIAGDALKETETELEELMQTHGFAACGEPHKTDHSANYGFLQPSQTELDPVLDINLEQIMPTADLTINSLCYELRSGTFSDPHHGLTDLEHGIIRVCGDPHTAFDDRGGVELLRAIKTACRFSMTIDPSTAEGIQRNNTKVRDVLADAADHPSGLLGEYHLYNMFCMFAYNAPRCMQYLQEFGIAQIFANFIVERLGMKRAAQPLEDLPELFARAKPQTQEQSISVFLSALARHTSHQPQETFQKIITLWSIATPKTSIDLGFEPRLLHYIA